MPGATPREAVETFLRPLRRVVSCVTRSILDVRGGYHPSDKPHSVIIGDGLSVPLAGPGQLKLRFGHRYRIVDVPGHRETWKVTTTGYFYSLDDSNDQEIVAYHWHPDGRSFVQFPHIHVGPGAGSVRPDLAAAHCPAGRTSIEEFLRFAINDFHVEPLRPDWSDVFDEAHRNFEAWRTWS